jgi:molybdopterin synthase sulfur carrier subunit
VNVECAFFGPLRESVGEKTVTVALSEGATVRDLLERLAAEHDLAFFEDGALRGDRTVTVDGKDVRHLGGPDTELHDGATVRTTTAVYGGAAGPTV